MTASSIEDRFSPNVAVGKMKSEPIGLEVRERLNIAGRSVPLRDCFD